MVGFGAVSVITGNLIGALFGAIFLWIINPWRPKFIFSKAAAKKVLSFGFSMLVIEFLAMVALQIDKWMIGRYLTVSMMGIYSIGIRIPEYLVKQISLSISRVSFPLFSQIKGQSRTSHFHIQKLSLRHDPLFISIRSRIILSH